MVKRSSLVNAVLRRRAERGASVLIVLLVIVMLTGIGMFAARSATLATAVAGSSKQLTETQYFSEYAIMSALARDPQRYVNQMPKYVAVANDPKCFGFATIPNATCFPMSFSQIQTEAGMPLVLPNDPVNKLPGGLGLASLETDFNIELTDLSPASPPVPGEALNARSPVQVGYLSITITSTAQLRPPTNAQNFNQTIASSASVKAWRAHVVVGPMSNPAARPPSQ